jgi:hypothetical protein
MSPPSPRHVRSRNPARQKLNEDTTDTTPHREVPSNAGGVYQLCVLMQSGIGGPLPHQGPNCRSTMGTNLPFHP